MKTFKKILRWLRLILLIAVAAFGIGITGGIPLQTTHKREKQEQTTEWVTTDDEEPESEQIKVIQ